MDKVVATAPGHVCEVRRLVFDALTKAQVRQLTSIGQRILRVLVPDDRRLDRQARTSESAAARCAVPTNGRAMPVA